MVKKSLGLSSLFTLVLGFAFSAASVGAQALPASQTFVDFHTADFSLQVPEGWKLSTNAQGTLFLSQLNGLSIRVETTKETSLDKAVHAALQRLSTGVNNLSIRSNSSVSFGPNQGLKIEFTCDSLPSQATGASVNLENQVYYWLKGDRFVELRLWSPMGSDNGDPWTKIAQSLRLTGS